MDVQIFNNLIDVKKQHGELHFSIKDMQFLLIKGIWFGSNWPEDITVFHVINMRGLLAHLATYDN